MARVCASGRICKHVHVCVCVRDSMLCHIPTVRGSVRLRLANMAVPPLWKLHNSSTQRGFCCEMRDNAGIGQGVRGVFLGDNIPTVTHKQASYVKTFLDTELQTLCTGTESCLGIQQGGSWCEDRAFCVFVCVLFSLTFCDARYSMPRATW